MKPCQKETTTNIPNTQIPIGLTCVLAEGHKGSHRASFTFNGVYAEAEWQTENDTTTEK